MADPHRPRHGWHVSIVGAGLDDALHRCIVLASPHGTIILRKPLDPAMREFVLELNQSGSHRLRWILRRAESGTDLTIEPQASATWLPGRGAAVRDQDLDRKLALLPTALNLKIVVLGGGTGLYTTLLGLRDRSWSLTAVIAGARRRGAPPDPKDELGLLPRDDASLCLVALAPTADDTLVVRGLLEHRMKDGPWQATHVGPLLLDALAEIHGSRQAGIDAAARLLRVRGRIALAVAAESEAGDTVATQAIREANLVVLAPGRIDMDLAPVLGLPSIAAALDRTTALKIAVTKIMTAEGDATDKPRTSHQLAAIHAVAPLRFDAVLANSASFTRAQLDAYAAVGAHPVVPDPEPTARYARLIVSERLVAAGHLARHDPQELAAALIGLGTDSFLAGHTPAAQTPAASVLAG